MGDFVVGGILKMRRYLLLFILGIAFLLRLTGINHGLPSETGRLSTYHGDESVTFNSLADMEPAKLNFNPGVAIAWGGFHLFPTGAVLKVMQIIGYVKPGTREFYEKNLHLADRLYLVGRMMSIIFATLSIYLLYLISRNLFGETTGLISSFLFAFSPVHILNSFLVRPDILMLLFALCVAYFSLILLDNPKTWGYFLIGILTGLTAATLYTGGIYLVLPLAVCILSRERAKKWKNLFFLLVGASTGFLIGCPYSILDTQSFLYYAIMVSLNMAGRATQSGHGYLYRLYYGLSMPILLFAFLGIIILVLRIIKKREKKLILLLLWLGATFFSASLPKGQVHYILPFVPSALIVSGYFLYVIFKKRTASPFGWKTYFSRVVVLCLLGYSIIYTFAYLNLYTSKDIRLTASHWIDKNIPKGEKIGIAISFFWTPPIIRKNDTPYKVYTGGGITSSVSEGICSLENLIGKVNYFVLSDYEYGTYLRYPDLYKKESGILKRIESNYKIIAKFEKTAEFLCFKFKKKNPPDDWMYVNPTIMVWKRKV